MSTSLASPPLSPLSSTTLSLSPLSTSPPLLTISPSSPTTSPSPSSPTTSPPLLTTSPSSLTTSPSPLSSPSSLTTTLSPLSSPSSSLVKEFSDPISLIKPNLKFITQVFTFFEPMKIEEICNVFELLMQFILLLSSTAFSFQSAASSIQKGDIKELSLKNIKSPPEKSIKIQRKQIDAIVGTHGKLSLEKFITDLKLSIRGIGGNAGGIIEYLKMDLDDYRELFPTVDLEYFLCRNVDVNRAAYFFDEFTSGTIQVAEDLFDLAKAIKTATYVNEAKSSIQLRKWLANAKLSATNSEKGRENKNCKSAKEKESKNCKSAKEKESKNCKSAKEKESKDCKIAEERKNKEDKDIDDKKKNEIVINNIMTATKDEAIKNDVIAYLSGVREFCKQVDAMLENLYHSNLELRTKITNWIVTIRNSYEIEDGNCGGCCCS